MKTRDRSEINKKLALENYFPPFFSVLLPELGRPDYVIEGVKHLIKHADMPFEVIIHDDGSGMEKQRKIFEEIGSICSTLVFNMGKNVGLGMAMNRCRSMARSKYLIKFDTDCWITSGVLRNMKEALDLPYCGIVNIVPDIAGKRGDHNLYVASNGRKVTIVRGGGMTSAVFGVRTDVYDAAGGWDENVQSTASDGGFLGNIFGNGMFALAVEGTHLNQSWLSDDGLINNSKDNPNYVSSARSADGDNNGPRIYGISDSQNRELSNKRREACWHETNDERIRCMGTGETDNSWYGNGFLTEEGVRLFPDGKFIDWEYAKEHGHDRWRDEITRDFNL